MRTLITGGLLLLFGAQEQMFQPKVQHKKRTMTNGELIQTLQKFPATSTAKVSVRVQAADLEVRATGFVRGVFYDPASSSITVNGDDLIVRKDQ